MSQEVDQVTRVLAVTPGMEYLALVSSEQRRAAVDACGFSPVFRLFRAFVMADEGARLNVAACAEFGPGLVGETVRLFPVPCGYTETLADWQAILYSTDVGEARGFFDRVFGSPLYHGFVKPVSREQVDVSPRDGVGVDVVVVDRQPPEDEWPEEVVADAWSTVVEDKLLPVVGDNPRVPGCDSFQVSGTDPMRDVRGYCYLRLFSHGARPYMAVALGATPFVDALVKAYTAAVVYGFAAHTKHNMSCVGEMDGAKLYHIEPGEVSWKDFLLILSGLRTDRARVGVRVTSGTTAWRLLYETYNLDDRVKVGAAIVAGRATPGLWSFGDLALHDAVMSRLTRVHDRVGAPVKTSVSRPLVEKALTYVFDYLASRHLPESKRPQVVAIGDVWDNAEGLDWEMVSGHMRVSVGETFGSGVRGSWFYFPEGIGVSTSQVSVVTPRNGVLVRVSGVIKFTVDSCPGDSATASIVYFRNNDALSSLWNWSLAAPRVGSTSARFLSTGSVAFLRLAAGVIGDVDGEPSPGNDGDWVALNSWVVRGPRFNALPRAVHHVDVQVMVENATRVVVAGWRFRGDVVSFSVAACVSPVISVDFNEGTRLEYSVVADDYCYDGGGPSDSDGFSEGL